MSKERAPRRWSDATRASLLEAGIAAFGEHGFDALSEDAIARRADLTRGALQYQFGGKKGLFAAAFDHVLQETARLIADQTMERAHSVAELGEGVGVLMDLALDPRRRRLLFVEAPVVLGWNDWREGLRRAFEPLLHHALGHWVEGGLISEHEVAGHAEVLLGAGVQAALAQGAGDPRPRAALEAMIARLAARP
ncbi:TetR/AcrR family transcriptional regulator [Phenylobacterium sp.]|uniref:TetR/AcrR family transcriptional regulator n=1 Tax=Phenylobacterium sp. TaxID=1871053 RepID=UPI0028A0FEE4|nr:TetR/AcrR family transcriptional regulator [Phenylobacterium sp.]